VGKVEVESLESESVLAGRGKWGESW